MASILPGFEYDIFISYRQNDNRSGWVTEFVNALKEELAATIKEPVSVYFDTNPNDGLLETHNVDKSLEGKLKCLIFIPIISQTYCDPKSFAWQHEFCAFNASARQDAFGIDVKLAGGNVTSRILPIKIHDLDNEDKVTIENELGGMLRAIGFIFSSHGVNRPLTPTDNPDKNLNKTFYRDQINKVARGIKDIASAMRSPSASKPSLSTHSQGSVDHSQRRKISWVALAIVILGLLGYSLFYFMGWGRKLDPVTDKSIAVLPFENMSKDPEQDYFSSGIAEDILNQLAKITALNVKSRTSTLQYKGSTKNVSEIGEELGVAHVLEGSVRRIGDQVRIVVQLIDTKRDVHLWSETYDRDFKDVLSLQNEIAIAVASSLEARLTSSERENINKEATHDITAYDYFLKARDIVNAYTPIAGDKGNLNKASILADHAIQLDKSLAKAFALKGRIWQFMRLSGVSEKLWTDSSVYYTSKAIELDPSDPVGYLVKASVLDFVGKRTDAAALRRKAYQVAPMNTWAQREYGIQLLREENEKGAELVLSSMTDHFEVLDPRYYGMMSQLSLLIGDEKRSLEFLLKANSLDPGSGAFVYPLAIFYRDTKEYDKALAILSTTKFSDAYIIDEFAEIYTLKGDFVSAKKYYEKYKEIEKGYTDTTQNVPFRHRLAFVYSKLGRVEEASKLMHEQLQILDEMIAGKRSIGTWGDFGNIYYDRALCLAYLGNAKKAVSSLDSAYEYGWRVHWYYYNDPLLVNVQNDPDFKTFLRKVDRFELFQKKAFTKALNSANASSDLKSLLEK